MRASSLILSGLGARLLGAIAVSALLWLVYAAVVS